MGRLVMRLALAGVLAGLLALALPSHARAEDDVAKVYVKNCVLCHAADGSGNSSSGKALKAKDLASSEVQKKSDQELAEVLTNGKGKMPAFGKKISADEIKELVVYIRALPKKK